MSMVYRIKWYKRAKDMVNEIVHTFDNLIQTFFDI